MKRFMKKAFASIASMMMVFMMLPTNVNAENTSNSTKVIDNEVNVYVGEVTCNDEKVYYIYSEDMIESLYSMMKKHLKDHPAAQLLGDTYTTRTIKVSTKYSDKVDTNWKDAKYVVENVLHANTNIETNKKSEYEEKLTAIRYNVNGSDITLGDTTDSNAQGQLHREAHYDKINYHFVSATGTHTHTFDNSGAICTTCGYDRTPAITVGANQQYTLGSLKEITITSNGEYDEFVDVLVDEKVIEDKNYTTQQGSTIVVLKPEYLETLSVGKHTIAIRSTYGTASTNLTVVEKPVVTPTTPSKPAKDKDVVKTADTSDIVLYAGLSILAVISMIQLSKKENA